MMKFPCHHSFQNLLSSFLSDIAEIKIKGVTVLDYSLVRPEVAD
jgi:hypothetical protein